MPKVAYLGMSGGIDSSVAALLLKGQGYHVVGVYMKNWSKDLPGMKCPWARDLADAKRVAVSLGIDFKVFDFETEYKQKVVDYMLAEYKKGRTPNPDIMCNQEIKFGFFAALAFEQGADFVATGHYAQVKNGQLLRAVDELKDQTYFLYRIPEKALKKTIFPVGHLRKTEVKDLAKKHGLHIADKPESMGICFVGEAGIREFLGQYIEPTYGEIREAETDQVLGQHDGAIFYTIGQRHGLDLGGGLPYYVVKKDMKNNIIYVSRDLNNDSLWADWLELADVVIRETSERVGASTFELPRGELSSPEEEDKRGASTLTQRKSSATKALGNKERHLLVRLRHRAPLISATFDGKTLTFKAPIKRPASGQSAVLYDGEICLGGGIIV